MPAQAGTQFFRAFWFPACAGMTTVAAFVFKSRTYFGRTLRLLSKLLQVEALQRFAVADVEESVAQ
jgi:hypothetical protein